MKELILIGSVIVLGLIVIGFLSKVYASKVLEGYVESVFYNTPDVLFDADGYQSVKRYYESSQGSKTVDETTWHDLDMDKVYLSINNSLSSVGDEVLYAHLRDQEDFDFEEFTALSEKLLNDRQLRFKVQMALGTLGRRSDNGLAAQLYASEITIPPQFQFLPYQRLLAFLPFVVLPFSITLGIFLFLGAAFFNIVTFFMLDKSTVHRLRTLNYFVDVLKCARKLEGDIEMEGLSNFSGIKSYIGNMSISMNEGTGLAGMLVLVNAYFALYGFSFVKILKSLNKHNDDAKNIFKRVGFVEMALIRASLMERTEVYCEPIFSDVEAPIVEDIVHPLVVNAVSNSVELKKNTLVTGSNASGKSTFVRSLAINVLLGQKLNFCFAKSMEFRPCFVATSMAISDDVQSGDSYFVAEVKSLKRLINASETYDYSLLIVDEILKGTNTIERIAASASILNDLKNQPCFICAATHDIELVNILESSYSNIHFREIIDAEGIHFDYKLQEGPSNTRNAIKLLEHYGYDETLITRANQLADDFGATQQWEQLK